MVLVESDDAGGKVVLSQETELAAELVLRLLSFCLVPRLNLETGLAEPEAPDYEEKDGEDVKMLEDDRYDAVVHGDLRKANLTENHSLIDFEYLGFDPQRAMVYDISDKTSYPEITCEQMTHEPPSLLTNVWQCGLLLCSMSGIPLGERTTSRKTTIKAIVEKAHRLNQGLYHTENFARFLQKCRLIMCTELVWRGKAGKTEMRKQLKILRTAAATFITSKSTKVAAPLC